MDFNVKNSVSKCTKSFIFQINGQGTQTGSDIERAANKQKDPEKANSNNHYNSCNRNAYALLGKPSENYWGSHPKEGFYPKEKVFQPIVTEKTKTNDSLYRIDEERWLGYTSSLKSPYLTVNIMDSLEIC
ncbi:hypothetical protein NPIL_280271 [Nephila pilipes]|uniref:Uncharacterized protein n=1 Tax=Nephila pilipes TaxID=299642 RepID=A0A8X6QVW8_NEPPI|nr:hypothetical protein NPIL_280271 [Nephila pilipes]